jgi:hypothetical protein
MRARSLGDKAASSAGSFFAPHRGWVGPAITAISQRPIVRACVHDGFLERAFDETERELQLANGLRRSRFW